MKVTQPRGLRDMEHVYYPPKEGRVIRTFWDPRKGHYVMPGTDHSFCGLGVCPPEDETFLIDSGWDEVAYFVYDDREPNTRCKPCADGWTQWQANRRPTRSLPQDSPVTAQEWAQKVGPEAMLEKRKTQMILNRFAQAGLTVTLEEQI